MLGSAEHCPEKPYQETLLYFPLGLNYSHITSALSNSANLQWSNTILTLSTGAAANSRCNIEGIVPIYLNQEEMVTVTITCAFAPPKPGLVQYIGIGDTEEGIHLGYKGLEFGVRRCSDGKQHAWTLYITGPCVLGGNISITLTGVTYTVPVTIGMTAQQILTAVVNNTSTTNANYMKQQFSDRVVLTADVAEVRNVSQDGLTFGLTGVTGSLETSTVVGCAPNMTWTPQSDFNGVIKDQVLSFDRTMGQVYRFVFSRWSCCSHIIGIMNPNTSDFDDIYVFMGSDSTINYKASIPYRPHIVIKNCPVGNVPADTSANTMATSMAIVSSGTPSSNTNSTRFSRTFTMQTLALTQNVDSVVACMEIPRFSGSTRNRMLACIQNMKLNCDTQQNIRIKIIIGGVVNNIVSTTQHLPWAAMKVGQPTVATNCTNGLEYSNSFYRANGLTERLSEFSQLWMPPGSTLTITACAISTAVTCTIDASIEWIEL